MARIDGDIHVHVHVHGDPGISAALGRIEAALQTQREDNFTMTQITKQALEDLGHELEGITDAVTANNALIDGLLGANQKLADELEAEGQDVTKLREFIATAASARNSLVEKTLANTPADPNAPPAQDEQPQA